MIRFLRNLAIAYLVIGLLVATGFDTLGNYENLQYETDPGFLLSIGIGWPLFVGMTLIVIVAAAANGC